MNLGKVKFASLTSITYSMFDDLRMGKTSQFAGLPSGESGITMWNGSRERFLVKNDDPYVQKIQWVRPVGS